MGGHQICGAGRRLQVYQWYCYSLSIQHLTYFNISRILHFISLTCKDILSFLLFLMLSLNTTNSVSNLKLCMFRQINLAITVLRTSDPQWCGERCRLTGDTLQHTVPIPRQPWGPCFRQWLDHSSGVVPHHTEGRPWDLTEVPGIGGGHVSFRCC